MHFFFSFWSQTLKGPEVFFKNPFGVPSFTRRGKVHPHIIILMCVCDVRLCHGKIGQAALFKKKVLVASKLLSMV
jgi:hypothetical protein